MTWMTENLHRETETFICKDTVKCSPGFSVSDVTVDESCGHLLQCLQHLITPHQDLGCQGQDAVLQLLGYTEEAHTSATVFPTFPSFKTFFMRMHH